MDKKKLIDIDDFVKSLNSLTNDIQAFHALFNTMNIEYINKISGTLDITTNSNYYIVRDSIFFRYDSILFHLRLLESIQKNQYEILNIEKNKQQTFHNYVFNFLDQQLQLFDSIVFHSISLFDYLANLIGLIIMGKLNMKWNGIINSVRDLNNSFSTFKISKVIKFQNDILIDKLYNYRSDLIHNSKDTGGYRSSHDFFKDEMKFTVLAPKKICNKFNELKIMTKENSLSINYVVFWLIEKILKSTFEIIESLIDHMFIHRKTPKDSDIFLIRKP